MWIRKASPMDIHAVQQQHIKKICKSVQSKSFLFQYIYKWNATSSIVRFVCNRAVKRCIVQLPIHIHTHLSYCIKWMSSLCLHSVHIAHIYSQRVSTIKNASNQFIYFIWLLWKLFSNFITKFIPRDHHKHILSAW